MRGVEVRHYLDELTDLDRLPAPWAAASWRASARPAPRQHRRRVSGRHRNLAQQQRCGADRDPTTAADPSTSGGSLGFLRCDHPPSRWLGIAVAFGCCQYIKQCCSVIRKMKEAVQMDVPRVVSREDWLVNRRELLTAERDAAKERMALSAERAALPMVKTDKEYDTTMALVSRAPLAKIEPFQARMGWTVPWYSSYGSDFNDDFHVTLDETITPIEYDYRDKATLLAADEPYCIAGEQDGLGVFLTDGESVYHTYSTFADGTGLPHGTMMYDLIPLGRQDDGVLRHHDRCGG
ncbi:DUF899 family protein [Actinomycetes bacterium KLBMP 9797]